VSQPIDEIGRVGAQMLIDVLASGSQRRQHVLPATLVVRGSTGPLHRQARSAERRIARTP
jgi:DNA-binding LacI/PurR family transcriptional regulator